MDVLQLKVKTLSLLAAFRARSQGRSKLISFVESLLNAIPVPIFVKTNSSTYLFVNTAFAEFVHKPKEQLLYGLKSNREAYVEEDYVLKTGEPVSYVRRYINFQGERKVVLVRLSRCMNVDNTGLIVGILTDITASDEQARKLKISEQTLLTLTDSTADLICVLDKSMRFMYCNARTSSIFGIEPKELLGSPIYALMTPASSVAFETTVYQGIEAGKSSIDLEVECLHINASPRILDMSVNITYDDDRVFQKVYVIGRDVTEKRRLRLQIERKERMLEILSTNLSRLLNTVDDHKPAIESLLRSLCINCNVQHAFILQNFCEGDKLLCRRAFDWHDDTAEGYSGSDYERIPLYAMSNILLSLQKGYSVIGTQEDIPDCIKDTVSPYVNSFILIPISVHQYFWGILGFEDSFTMKSWSSDEIHVLQVAATSIGACIYIQDLLKTTMHDKQVYEKVLDVIHQQTRKRVSFIKAGNEQLRKEMCEDADGSTKHSAFSTIE